ncbi:MAG: hypothetical protein CVV64_05650 [Candidatus Wallbacteria bacterium HGW-Wallbacteria-1]|jgi:hypothetical protein|uniref:Uncharacterized protein n=1 Tax=Candidatus Wallbacteria bacterium HGW-Wallbacteria-1 TaxID=2013854 RepID=A0A2N1PSE0_9BACT|nr:MAG: hypothetical protein CVV64_05650 [Candidatus Wallbacteria bacterium HGW-Wallbacteria-1]
MNNSPACENELSEIFSIHVPKIIKEIFTFQHDSNSVSIPKIFLLKKETILTLSRDGVIKKSKYSEKGSEERIIGDGEFIIGSDRIKLFFMKGLQNANSVAQENHIIQNLKDIWKSEKFIWDAVPGGDNLWIIESSSDLFMNDEFSFRNSVHSSLTLATMAIWALMESGISECNGTDRNLVIAENGPDNFCHWLFQGTQPRDFKEISIIEEDKTNPVDLNSKEIRSWSWKKKIRFALPEKNNTPSLSELDYLSLAGLWLRNNGNVKLFGDFFKLNDFP